MKIITASLLGELHCDFEFLQGRQLARMETANSREAAARSLCVGEPAGKRSLGFDQRSGRRYLAREVFGLRAAAWRGIDGCRLWGRHLRDLGRERDKAVATERRGLTVGEGIENVLAAVGARDRRATGVGGDRRRKPEPLAGDHRIERLSSSLTTTRTEGPGTRQHPAQEVARQGPGGARQDSDRGRQGLQRLLTKGRHEGRRQGDRPPARRGHRSRPPRSDASARTLVDRHYMLDGQRTLHRYRGEFWQWQTTHYRSVDEEMIRERDLGIPRQGPAARQERKAHGLQAEQDHSRQRHDALAAICQLDGFIEAPTWLSESDNLPATEFVAVSNGLLHLPTRKLILRRQPSSASAHRPWPMIQGQGAREVAGLPRAGSRGQHGDLHRAGMVRLRTVARHVPAEDPALHRSEEIGQGHQGTRPYCAARQASVAGPTMGSLGETFGLEPLITKPLAIISDARIGQRPTSPSSSSGC